MFSFVIKYGRLIDHCEPVHRKYQLAITKVMGKSMDAIVVDCEKTARECIQFMKEQRIQSETFYPLDFIDAQNLDERLREIRDPKNTKLLFDVIKFNPPQMKKALLFAVGNCLVCESDEDARKLAFGTSRRHKVVSLDGTLFQKSGLISGGSFELRQKARRWDEKHMESLRRRKDHLTEQLKELIKIKRKEPELIDLRANLKGLEYRLKYSKQNQDKAEGDLILKLKNELEQLKVENAGHEPKIKQITDRIQERSIKIKKTKEDSNKIEDEIFKDFCHEIGVENIRIYEEKELAGQQETVKERMVFKEKETRLKSQLEFEKSRNTLKNCNKWEKDLKENEQELLRLSKEEETLKESICELERQIENKNIQIEEFKLEANGHEIEVNELKKKVFLSNKEVNDCRKKINTIEAKLMDRKLERHAILKNSKLDFIDLPMIIGSMDDINEEDIGSQPVANQNSDNASDSSKPSSFLNSLSTQDQTVIFEKESRIKLDYKQLDTEFLNVILKLFYFKFFFF